MKNKLAVAASLLVALVFTVVLLLSAGGKGDKAEKPVKPNKPDTTVSVPVSENSADTAEPKTEQPTQVVTDIKAENKRTKSDSAALSVLGYAFGEVSACVTDTPAEKVPVTTVSFIACGDNLVHSSVYSDAKTLAAGTDKEYNFIPMYDNVADVIKNADLAFINQETPFGGSSRPISGYPMFNTPEQMGDDLVELGFDIIGLANNHMLDSTSKGYENTIDYWSKWENVTAIGGYKNKEDFENIRIVEKNGIKIALLAYTYGTNGLTLPKGSELVIPLYDDETLDRQTKKAREMADCVIVSIHWGVEDNFKPNTDQKRKAKLMADNGVDVIIGHHPHVLQPLEWIDRADGGKTLCMYSLGNFLSGMMYSRNMVGGILGFDISKAPNGVSIDNAYFIPTVCQYNNKVRGFKIYRFSEYTDALEQAHGAHKFDSSMSMKSMRKIIDNAIPKEFLTEDFYNN